MISKNPESPIVHHVFAMDDRLYMLQFCGSLKMDPVKDTDGNQCVKGADGHGWVFSIGVQYCSLPISCQQAF